MCVAEKSGLPGGAGCVRRIWLYFLLCRLPFFGNLFDIQYNYAYTERIILCFTGYPLSTHYNSNLRTAGSQMAKLLMALYESGHNVYQC